jgi:Circularly permutated YpsA SLOG family
MALKIVCGGQTGVDRAALDAAIALHIAYGGWCPRGGWAEDYPDPPGLLAVYPDLKATPSADPAVRTRWNVRDSDRTLILVGAGGLAASPGTGLTVDYAEEIGRPHLVVPVDDDDAARQMSAWLAGTPDALILNVAGPRESEAPGIYGKARRLLEAALNRDTPP